MLRSLLTRVFGDRKPDTLVETRPDTPVKKKKRASAVDFERPFLSYRDLPKIAKREAAVYRGADPFPHIVLDNLFDRAILRKVRREISGMDRTVFHKTDDRHEVKLSTEDDSQLGPVTWKLVQSLNSGAFLSFLEVLTSTPGLIADPHLRGGGVHEIERGGKLGIHADFNFYKRLKVYRRLNLLLYLNHGWDEAWGGHLELWDRTRTRCRQRIAPLFNRMVIFDTSSTSFHGHPSPLDCPEEESRKSLALYYYTVGCPDASDHEPHSTNFVNVDSNTLDAAPPGRGPDQDA